MACVFLLPVAFSPAAHGRSKRVRLPGSTSCIIHCGCRPGNVVLLPCVAMLLRPASLRPTVCLDVTSLVVYSDGYNSGNIVQLVAHEWAVHVATPDPRSARLNCSLPSQRAACIAALDAEHFGSHFPGAASLLDAIQQR